MEKFVVSARKYRPITFDTVVGQSHITTTLQNAIRTNHLAQAFLFCGPRGVGKTTCARILAKTINCQNLTEDISPCNECESCKSFNNNASFNIHELDAASNNSVEDIRNLTDQVRFPPQSGKYKIYIIDEVHMLSQAAFNAFLKTLEEPPSYAIFILATTEKHKILPTILSRCQIFDFNRIQIKDIADHLANVATKENIKADYQALELIAQKADGGLRDALSMFDLNVTFSSGNGLTYQAVLDNLHILDYDYYFQMTDALAESKVSEAFLLFNEILEKGFDGHQFVVGLNEHFRNLMVSKDPQTVKLLQVAESIQQRYIEQSGKLSLGYIFSSLSIGSQLDINYKSAKNQRLHVEIGLMKLAQIQQVLNLSELPSSGEEKKNTNSAVRTETISEQKPIPAAVTQTTTSQAPPSYVPTVPVVGPKNISMPNIPSPTPGFQSARPSMASSKLRSTVDIESSVFNPKTNESVPNNNADTNLFNYNEPFTFEAAQQALFAFANESDLETLRVMLKRDFELNGTTFHLHLDNQIQMDTLTQIKQDLATFLRQRLRNVSIQITAEMLETISERRPYTAQEKFEYLANKNPALYELREKLGLELVF
ncbi:DNA polymerase III, subunits gamma and tau [Emticicia oligotrophica DSM 17448]|uniref:DNA polymerase III subunit gamma/tau n=1 Tax=Emticicia oligotrophica (strain DSM 17448 / CIP 109782 / MTCC 6937 / GPTSA100-15) TaxID=929562 RepID=A0ABN4ARI0_EMTOG|nr:DNA polymerase III subunit gamma/tau [Emticicia oligotrophica]AFK04077.1 DNA polymerase III, subunits gamma and tau [Emticicia oligotrophica DSM 17448]